MFFLYSILYKVLNTLYIYILNRNSKIAYNVLFKKLKERKKNWSQLYHFRRNCKKTLACLTNNQSGQLNIASFFFYGIEVAMEETWAGQVTTGPAKAEFSSHQLVSDFGSVIHFSVTDQIKY